jgi:hypothetical protein
VNFFLIAGILALLTVLGVLTCAFFIRSPRSLKNQAIRNEINRIGKELVSSKKRVEDLKAELKVILGGVK